jgi:WS/DGAT/MGAT family acyltransferase
MRQLTPHDAHVLHADTAHAHANLSFVQVYDQRTATGGVLRFKRILAHIAGRLHRSPVFRSKLLRVPLELDYPYWVEDEHFDLEYHVRHIALPKPGDWRQFCIQVSRIHARALDRDRPLWEIYVIEGLDSVAELPVGSFALLTKLHHAVVDPDQPNAFVELLHDLGPNPPAALPPEPWFPQPAPRGLQLLYQGALHTVLSPGRLVAPLKRLAPKALAFASDLLRSTHPAATRFNSVVSAHRVFDTRRFKLAEVERIQSLLPGVGEDEVVLAVCAGGLRRYLAAHGELPATDLAAIAPLAPVAPGAGRMPGPLHIAIGSHLADPLARLAHIHQQVKAARPGRGGSRRAPPKGSAKAMLPGFTVVRLAAPTDASSEARYLAGARLCYVSALLPIHDGIGLAIAVSRCDGKLIVSPTSCRELMPDPLAFTQCIRDSFQEYLALTTVPRPEIAKSAPRRVSASGRRSPSARPGGTAAIAPPAARAGRPRSTAPRR